MKERGLRGVQLVIGDRCLGLVEAARDVLPDAKIQRCIAHFYRNVSSKVPKNKMKAVANMAKAIHAMDEQESGEGKGRVSREGAKGHEAE